MPPRFRRTPLVVTAAALVAAATAAPGAGARESRTAVAEAPRQVTSGPAPDRLFVNPQLAVSPVNPATVVMAVADARNGGCSLQASRDGGLSWAAGAPSLLPEGYQYCVQRTYGTAMAPVFARDGSVYVAMSASSASEGHPNGPISMVVARTTDLGATSRAAVVARAASGDTYTLPDGSQAVGLEQHKLPSLTVDPNDPNRVYAAWRLTIRGPDQAPVPGWSLGGRDGIPSRTLVATSGDGGRTWSKPVDVLAGYQAERVYGSGGASLVAASDGTIYGFTRESPRRTPSDTERPSSRLFMFTSSDSGRTWQTSVVNEGAQLIDEPQAAIGPDDRLYLAYSSRGATTPAGTPANPSEVYVSTSGDRGRTWSDPVNVTDDDPARRASQYLPGISVGADGRVDVAFYDFRNDPFFNAGAVGNMNAAVDESYWDVYLTHSGDRGSTWAANTRVTEAPVFAKVGITFNNQDIRGPMGIASTPRAAYVAWPDTRATTAPNSDAEDAYFSRVRFADPTPLGATTGSSSGWAWGLGGVGLGLAMAGVALLVGRRTGPTATPAQPGRASG